MLKIDLSAIEYHAAFPVCGDILIVCLGRRTGFHGLKFVLDFNTTFTLHPKLVGELIHVDLLTTKLQVLSVDPSQSLPVASHHQAELLFVDGRDLNGIAGDVQRLIGL